MYNTLHINRIVSIYSFTNQYCMLSVHNIIFAITIRNVNRFDFFRVKFSNSIPNKLHIDVTLIILLTLEQR